MPDECGPEDIQSAAKEFIREMCSICNEAPPAK